MERLETEFEDLLVVFANLKKEFDTFLNYEDKIKFWKKSGFSTLVCSVDYLDKAIVSNCEPTYRICEKGRKWKNIYYNTKGGVLEYTEFISLIPKNRNEFVLLLVSAIDDMIDCELVDLVVDYMKDLFFENIKLSKLPRDLINAELLRVNNFIRVYEKEYYSDDDVYRAKPLRILFDKGYNNVLYGNKDLYDVSGLLDKMYLDPVNSFYKEYYQLPLELFIPFFRGISYAEYKAFLEKFLEDYNSLNQIEGVIKLHEEGVDNPVIRENSSKIKLLWNGDKSVLYDLFSQLTMCSNGDGQPVISNTLEALSQFLVENVEGLPSAKTVKRQLEKMRKEDSIDIPKRNRIVITIKKE